MKQPFINVEEHIDRFAEKPADSPTVGTKMQADSIEKQESSPRFYGRGKVYRFKTHEEADEWMNRMKVVSPR